MPFVCLFFSSCSFLICQSHPSDSAEVAFTGWQVYVRLCHRCPSREVLMWCLGCLQSGSHLADVRPSQGSISPSTLSKFITDARICQQWSTLLILSTR